MNLTQRRGDAEERRLRAEGGGRRTEVGGEGLSVSTFDRAARLFEGEKAKRRAEVGGRRAAGTGWVR